MTPSGLFDNELRSFFLLLVTEFVRHIYEDLS